MADEPIVAQEPAEGSPVDAPPPVVEPIAAAADTPSLLNSAPEKPAEEPAAEPAADPAPEPAAEPAADPAVDPAAVDEPKPAAEPEPAAPAAAEPVQYEALTLPEGVTMEAERVAAFDTLAASVRLPPEVRQEFANLHIAEMQRYDQQMRQQQQDIFAQTRQAWRDEVKSDPSLWRAGVEASDQPAIHAAMRMLDEFIPNAQREAFDTALRVTGFGDHPMLIRLLNNIAKKFDAPPVPTPPAGPAPDRGGAGGTGRRMRDLYTHPRSKPS